MTTMKKSKLAFIPVLTMLLAACTMFQKQPAGTEATAINIPNPASVYCEQNGNSLEIHSAEDGGQSGVCVFADGSTCDEWAYFRGECGPEVQPDSTVDAAVEVTKDGIDAADLDASGGYMSPGASEPIADWWGVIKSNPAGSQYDDYFERQDLGQVIYFGIDSMDPAIKSQIESLRDTGIVVHLYGTLFSNVDDYNGSQIQVERIETDK
jgi:putative hemolysin